MSIGNLMIDPLISLAFAIQTNRGAYALLLGSGLSRAAQIPTGWEIVLDLIGRLAKLEGEECEPDRTGWYRAKYSEEPDYAKLIQLLAKSPEERHQFLRGYFEPNDEEREQGLKLPTAAHRGIADLVAKGYVRVIITTNFDRLLERAIEEAGVTPTVLSTADAIEGSLPVVHQRCVVMKVHGDYLDTRIRNTPEELAIYDERINCLVDRILDEFGLLVCGWSADWDRALCAAFDRCKNRRFTLYWASRGDIGENARRLLQARSGTIIKIKDADSFFTQLSERVLALQDMQQLHPLSAATAAATVKRLISEPRHRVRLYELLTDETEAAFSRISDLHKRALASQTQEDVTQKIFDGYFEAVSVVRSIMIHGCYWAQPEHYDIFTKCVPRIARDPQRRMSGYKIVQGLRAAPGAFLFYAGGISALAANNYGMFAHLMGASVCRDDGKEGPFVIVYPWNDLHGFAQRIPGVNHRYAADSKWLFDRLREPLRPLLVGDDEYELTFDRFEYLRSLVYIDLKANKHGDDEVHDRNVPIGLFLWRDRSDGSHGRI
jgi:phosphoserine phosphatase